MARTPSPILAPTELAWAAVGLLLTIVGTFVEASATTPPWQWPSQGIHAYPLGVRLQVGAVLLVGCMGGPQAAVLSQLAYLLLGLAGLPVFEGGGGPGYVTEPSFGYLLGFSLGAWVCGRLAFRGPSRLEWLALSCGAGLLSIHAVGLAYLLVTRGWGPELTAAAVEYSWEPLWPGQLAIACGVAVLAAALRRVLFY